VELLNQLEREMLSAAEALEFEKAARLRNRISELKEQTQEFDEKAKNKKGKSVPESPDEEPPDTKENWEYKEPTKTTRGTKRKK